MSKTCLVYIGGDNPPDYCLENFVDEADLLALLKVNCQRVANAKRTKNSRKKLQKKIDRGEKRNSNGRRTRVSFRRFEMTKPEIEFVSDTTYATKPCTHELDYLTAWDKEIKNGKIYNNFYIADDYKIISSITKSATTYTNAYTNDWYYDPGTTAVTSYYAKWDNNNLIWTAPVVAPSDRIRQMIRDRMAPAVHRGNKRQSLSIAMDVREERARQTLRRIIGEQAYRKFIRDGFITVVPESGLTYRIYPGHGITDVYDKGIMVDRLCVVLQGNFPPTDSILMRYLLILNDEGEFSKYAVKHTVWQGKARKLVLPAAQPVALTEEWAKLKVA